MKPILPSSLISALLRYPLRIIFFLSIIFSGNVKSSAQVCAAGYTRDTINWDNLDFLHKSGNTYGGKNTVAPNDSFVLATMVRTQYVTLSQNLVTITTSASFPSGTHIPTPIPNAFWADVDMQSTASEAGTFGTGEELKLFAPASPGKDSIEFTFTNAVKDAKFSIYDIDFNQLITVKAWNGATPLTVTVGNFAGSNLTIATGNPGTAQANANVVANSTNTNTANFTISGDVTKIRIIASGTSIKTSGGPSSGWEDGGFFISDISACFPDVAYPTTYYTTNATPWTNQPAYFLANPQNLSVYMVNASSGVADLVFTDPGVGGNKMNSLAYDPVNHWLYYIMDNQPTSINTPVNRKLKKYDFTTNTISDVIPNLYTFGIPTFIQGIEFGGAAFYNGSLYLGVEESDGVGNATGAESVVWKIDFNGSGTATSYSQVFAQKGDNGNGSRVHDWGDFVIKDGVIISHGTNATSNQYVHYNMQTGSATTYSGDATTAGQLAQIYNGNIYRVKNDISLYNMNGSITGSTAITVTSCSPAWVNNAGDVSDPFKPMCDFGDGPSTYDPVALSPAANQKACNNSTLRIGSAWGDEWSKATSTDASGDDEEDGITTVTTMVSDGTAYNHVQDVVVLNNTGATAYLAAWLDYNANGVFDASEGVLASVPSSASPQTISLSWTGITVAVGTPNSFLRVRLASTSFTTSNATGWYSDGETEDYPVISSAAPLTIQLLDFNASLTSDKNVLLKWKASSDNESDGFEVERSKDQVTWEKIGAVKINSSGLISDYNFLDQQPNQGKSYYRLKMIEKSGSSKYSSVRLIQIDQLITKIKVYPNPTKRDVTVSFNSSVGQTATLTIRSIGGEPLIKRNVTLSQGENKMQVSVDGLSNGLYLVELSTSEKTFINRLTIAH